MYTNLQDFGSSAAESATHFENQLESWPIIKFEYNGHQPVEVFLGDLHGQMDLIKQQHLMFLYELGYTTKGRP